MESRQQLIPGASASVQACGGGPHRRSQRGFTLVEIMVVVLLIGTLLAIAILSLGATGKDSGLQQERDRLSALMAYARERGEMLTIEYGIRCGQHGYRFVYYDNIQMRWAPETVDDTLRPRKLPAGLTIGLIIEGHPIVLSDKALQYKPQTATVRGPNGSLLGSSSGASGLGTGGLGSGSLGSGSLGSGSLGSGSLGSGGLGSGSPGSGSSPGGTGGLGSGVTSLSGGGSPVGSGASLGSGGGLGSGVTSLSGGSSSGGYSAGAQSSSFGSSGYGGQTDENMPQILLFSNGDTNSFAFTLTRDGVGRSATLKSSASGDGTIEVGDITEPKR